MHQALLSFNAGEVTPYLRHRIDFDKTAQSCEELRNFLSMAYGGVIKRPGLQYVAATAEAGVNSKAFPFVCADGTRYIIHFSGYVQGDGAKLGSIKVIRAADGTVAATFAAGTSTDVGFLWTDTAHPVRSLQMAALNDIAYFSHGHLYPFQLSRYSDTDWRLSWVPFENPPLLDQNLDEKVTICVHTIETPTAWEEAKAYYIGDVVTYSGSTYTVIRSHTSHATNYHPGGGHEAYYAAGDTGYPTWTTGIAAYAVVGDRVTYEGAEWLCIADPSHSTAPGADYAQYQQIVHAAGTTVKLVATCLPAWTNGVAYVVGDFAWVTGKKYRCKLAHTAATGTNKPEVDGAYPDGGDCWELVDAIFPQFSITNQAPGPYWQLDVYRHADRSFIEISGHESALYISPTIPCYGPWSFTTYGDWFGVFQIEESLDWGGTWKKLRAYRSAGDRNVSDAGIADTTRLMRLTYPIKDQAADNKPRCQLEPDLPYCRGLVRGSTWTSAGEITARVSQPVLSGTTSLFAPSAFTVAQGFPRAVAFHEARLCYAATDVRPVSLWLSRSDDYMNFETGVDADHGIFATLATSLQAPIQWLGSQRRLFLGTSLGEWVAGSETSDKPLAPTDFLVRQYAANGSIALQPLLVGPALIFCARAGARLLEMSYASETEVYDTADLSRLAEHLTHAGIQSLAWQQTREPGMWLVRTDGVLLHFSYSRAEKIAAWSRHDTHGGLFRDVVVFPGTTAGDDDIFFIVDRGSYSLLERFPQNWQAAIEAGTGVLPWFHVDGTTGSGTSITIPVHLRDHDLTVVKILESTPTVVPTVTTESFSTGTGDLPGTTDHYHWQIGYPIESRLSSLPIDTAAQDGTTQARCKRQHKLITSLYRSRGGHVFNTSEARKQPIYNASPDDLLRTGWQETITDAGHLDDLQLHLVHDDPWPFILRAAVMRWALHEK